MHVDAFIDDHRLDTKGQRYARWVLQQYRLPAFLKSAFQEFIQRDELYCTYDGKRWRVTGCSNLGDIWLHSELNRDPFGFCPYEVRVEVMDCSEWSDKP